MLAGVTIVDPASTWIDARRRARARRRSSTRSPCSAGEHDGRRRSRDRPARRRGRRRDRGAVRWSDRSVTFAPAPSSTRARRQGTFVEIKNSRIGAADQGAAPLLHRRRRHRRGHEHRARATSPRTSRTTPGRAEGPDDDRQATSGPGSTMRSLRRSRLGTMHGLRPDRSITEDVPPGCARRLRARGRRTRRATSATRRQRDD